MGLDAKQIEALKAPLITTNIKKNPRGHDYVEAWHAIAEANRIFGFDGWSRQTIEFSCVAEKERQIGKTDSKPGYPGFGVSYIAKVKITVGDTVVREGCGTGHGIDRDLGLAHESALKEAESDAMKRALMTFGNPFGLALYDKTRANVADESDESRVLFVAECKQKIADMDAALVAGWWNSEQEKKARRDMEITPDELKTLMDLVKAKIPKKEAA